MRMLLLGSSATAQTTDWLLCRAARESMVLKYAPAVVAKQIAAEVERIEQAKSGGMTSDK